MKKIALLVTLFGVSIFNGMEPEKPELRSVFPEDVQSEIIKIALATSDNLEGVIKAINVANALRGVSYDNLETFTKLVHMLADKFNTTTQAVAEKIGTSIAKTYLYLGTELLRVAAIDDNGSDTNQLIKKGADVNFTGIYIDYSGNVFTGTPLQYAIHRSNLLVVKILLNYGLIPTTEDLQIAQTRMELNSERRRDESERWYKTRKETSQNIYILLAEKLSSYLKNNKAREK